MPYLAVGATFFTVALLLAAVISRRQRSRLTARMLLERDPLEQQATSLRLPGMLDRLEQTTHAAGINWSRKSFLLVWAVGLSFGAIFLISGDPMFGLGLPAAAIIVPLLWIQRRAKQRADLFATQLPTALTLMANSIRAGGSLYHAVGAVVRQMPDPIKAEFARVEKAVQLQVPVADALAKVQDRIGLSEFASVVIACKVAGEAGADLDKVLESIARELVEDRQFVKALEGASAEGRSSARLVTLVPVVIIGMITFLNPQYLAASMKDPTVVVLDSIAVGTIVLGWLFIKRITDVRNW